MTGLETTLVVVVAVWLAVISFVLILVVRQIGLLTVRVSFAAPEVPVDEVGLPVGTEIPDHVLDGVSAGGRPVSTLLLLSGTCGDCRGLATGLKAESVGDGTLVLIAGGKALAEEVAELLPAELPRMYEPEASRIANALGIDTVPFGMNVAGGVIRAKSFLRSASDVERLNARVEPDEGTMSVVQVPASNGDGAAGEVARR